MRRASLEMTRTQSGPLPLRAARKIRMVTLTAFVHCRIGIQSSGFLLATTRVGPSARSCSGSCSRAGTSGDGETDRAQLPGATDRPWLSRMSYG